MRFTAFASPKPIAVPSSIMPYSTDWNRFTSTAWSVVSGHCVKLSPANTTRPIWSFGRFLTNSDATSLAASKRFGFKSSANMVPDISSAIMMSIPSVDSDDHLLVNCGRAKAMLSSAIAATRSTNGTCNNHTRNERGWRARVVVSLICTLASALRISCQYHKRTGTSSSPNNKYPGLANVINSYFLIFNF